MTSAPLPDAGSNWVDRHAPEPLKPWLKLGRFDRPVGIWLLLLPGWQGIALAWASGAAAPANEAFMAGHAAGLFVLFAIGAGLMRAAGCAFNDIVDRKIDRQVARTASRPVASGEIAVNQAGVFVVVCSFISLQILLAMNWTTVMLGIGSLALVAAYPFMKRITWWPQAWLGLTFNWGALMGFAAFTSAFPWSGMPHYWRTGDLVFHAHAGMPGHLTAAALLLYLGGVFWTLGYDTIYALQDIEDDAMVGVKSSARRLGSSVPRGVAAFYGLAVACAAAAGALARPGPLFWLGLVAYALHLAFQTRRIRTDDPALALRLFKSNRDAGLILLAAIGLGALTL
ncbi:UbiA family prenyltransferase [Brevundimonas sp.]|uniref:UbiA family prenyltransferase n=1 Tax=Brevundimonas sp. TaxID=1871086 RepID=UPI002CFD0CF9|nr:UbiA family prenyltransferase [Brevundimonas sp.]HWQ87576.1 UbiA family prenyltransferase [Brevundimonas sp.]